MKYLQIFNLALLALGITLALVLGVESLIYALYLHADPLVGRQLPLLLRMTAVMCGFAGASLVAYHGHRRRRAWRWPAQALPLIGAGAVLFTLAQITN